jgi:Zinc binding domain
VTDRSTRCPTCGEAGAAVERITLKALLLPDGLRRGIPEEPQYCATADCPTVYFAADGDVTFTESDLTVSVYAKHASEAETPVCYCFGMNVGSLREAPRTREIREMIRFEVQAGHCACEVKNPKGGCCLGDLVKIEQSAEQATSSTSCCAV